MPAHVYSRPLAFWMAGPECDNLPSDNPPHDQYGKCRMATFLLIHGSWHGGWCWEEVTPLLEAQGHRVLAPDLPGMGADRTPWGEDIQEAWTEAMAAMVGAQPEPVIVVGHSRGGIVVSSVVERLPSRVALAVYVAAYMLSDGENLLDVGVKGEVEDAIHHDMSTNCLILDHAKATSALYGQAPLDSAVRAVARLTGEPLQSFTSRIHLSDERFGCVPRVYVETSNDRAIPLSYQRAMQARWPCASIVKLGSDHSPFYSMPGRLAEVLIDLAIDFAQEPDDRLPRVGPT